MKQKQSTIYHKKKAISVSFGVAEQPSTKINKSRGYVEFGSGAWRNLYPQYLIDLYENSPTHGAIINGKVKYIFGKGLYSDESQMDLWLQRANKQESWNDLYFKAALDYEIHNRFYFEVVRTRENGKRYYHLDASRVRIGEEEGTYVYSDDWDKTGRKDLDVFVLYDRNKEIQRNKDGSPIREIIPYDEYRPNFDYYGYPNYMNVITSVEAEKEISNYDLNQWKYGFLGATMINLNSGSPETEEQEAQIVKTIKDTIGGSGGDNILVNFSDNKDTAAEILGVKGENSAQEADMTAKRISATIFTGHTVTNSALFGVKEAGQLGNRNEILEAYELFKETYISIRQNRLLSVIEDISGLEGLQVKELSPISLEPNIAEIAPYLKPIQVTELIQKKYGLDFTEEEVVEEATFAGFDPKQERNEDGTWGDGSDEKLTKVSDQLEEEFPKLTIDIYQNDKNEVLTLSRVIVPEDLRGQGIGSDFMNSLTKKADRLGYKIILTPSNDFGGNKARLIEFYKRFGFVLNKGENRDYSHREDMYRLPNEATFASSMTEEQAQILKACDSVGFSKEGYTEIASQSCKFKDGKLQFAELTKLDLWILKILSDNPEFSAEQITKEANLNKAKLKVSEVYLRLGKLIGLGWIIGEGAKYILSKLGEREADKEPLPEVELQLVYSYELRPDAQPLLTKEIELEDGTVEVVEVNGSRQWCKDMMEKDKYYTKEAIEQLNNDLKTDVWLTRGGWLTKTGTDISLPFCRHYWKSTVISKNSDNSDKNIER